MNQYLKLFLTGLAMGAANVIPGVSGGTIAFITGIYERLITAIKGFNPKALRMLLKGEYAQLVEYVDLKFLLVLFAGVGLSVVSLAKVLEIAFCEYPILTNAFFFGLIMASVYVVAKQVTRWGIRTVAALIIGVSIAVAIGMFNPAGQNDNPFYLFLCGMVAISSMVLPGLSGSYVLLIMGNYLLVLGAISELNFGILIPFALGCGLGLMGFSYLLAYVFKHYYNIATGLLAGFVLGSLFIIWPWKNVLYKMNEAGDFINKKGEVIADTCREGIVVAMEQVLPTAYDATFFGAIGLMAVGVVSVLMMEKLGTDKPTG